MAHIRWYFMRALDNNRQLAAFALENIFGPLYKLEVQCKAVDMDYDEIKQAIQQIAVPVLNAFKQWLQQQLPFTIPGTPSIRLSNMHYRTLRG